MDSCPSTFVLPVNGTVEGSDGGPIPVVSTNAGSRLTGAQPQPPKHRERTIIYRCNKCGSADMQVLAWVHGNTGEVLEWSCEGSACNACADDCFVVRDYGHGFELWREGEFAGRFRGYLETLAEARRSSRPYEIFSIDSEGQV
ncbi:MAG: hypothetical protein IT381_14200 [Deltaproteobacteria bacterium]|nr:hypothetical protein [Deltaproteobacteria bacterium]